MEIFSIFIYIDLWIAISSVEPQFNKTFQIDDMDYKYDGDKETNDDLNIIDSNEQVISHPKYLVEMNSKVKNNVNVQFTLEEAKFVVNILDEKVEQISKIEQKLKRPISHDKNRQISSGMFTSQELLESEEQAVDYSNRVLNNRDTCLCGEGTPPPMNPRDFYKAASIRFQKKNLEMRKRARRELNRNSNRHMNVIETNRNQEDRIVNGYSADSRPWMATFGQMGGDELKLTCGGALLNHRFIL